MHRLVVPNSCSCASMRSHHQLMEGSYEIKVSLARSAEETVLKMCVDLSKNLF